MSGGSHSLGRVLNAGWRRRNPILASILTIPTAFLVILPLGVVGGRLQNIQFHEAQLLTLKGELDALQRVAPPAQERIRTLAQSVRDRIQAISPQTPALETLRQEMTQAENSGAADLERLKEVSSEIDAIKVARFETIMQGLYGSQKARDQRLEGKGDWGSFFHEYSNDNNVMIAAIASACLATLLTVILQLEGSVLFAIGAGIPIGLFAMIAARGAKAFLVSGPTLSSIDLDPYNIVFLAFIAGAYKSRLLGLLNRFISDGMARMGVAGSPQQALPKPTPALRGPGASEASKAPSRTGDK